MYAVKLSAVPRRRTAAKYSGNVSNSHAMPAASVAGSMSSTFSSVPHDRVAVLRAGRRDREAAVARDHGGHAVVRRRPQRRIPEHLRVVVGVDVDEAGCNRAARSVELVLAAQVGPDLADHTVGDRDVGDATGRAASVEDRTAADDDVSRHRIVVSPDFAFVSGRAATSSNFTMGRPAVVPPSTGSTMPVTCADRSLARYSAAFATSVGEPMRCSGCISTHDRRLVVGAVDVGGDVRRRDAVHPDAVFGDVDRDATA